jgi:pimeloyl-ACP methyl ester carboxylesterase
MTDMSTTPFNPSPAPSAGMPGMQTASETTRLNESHAPQADVGFIEVNGGLTLRRMIVRNPHPEGTVLLLHGFLESVYAWKEIALSLGRDYEVHAFDWPGFGLSSRPDAESFSYSPKDYARILDAYIEAAGIDSSTLTIYATDIGALPALLLALDKPEIAKTLVVGDFAPFDRPGHMWPNLQALKAQPSSEVVRTQMNANRDEILANAFTRGLPDEARFEVSQEFRDDVARAWEQGAMTSVDAFYHYYSHFSRDQQYFESNIGRLKTPVRVVWGEQDVYINKGMGMEFAEKANVPISVLPGIGHYLHLQTPTQAIAEIRATFH